MITLIDVPLSPYAIKVKIALLEKQLPFKRQSASSVSELAAHLAAQNPRNEVPLLIDGDFAIYDSTVILEYLEDKYPQRPLLPKDAQARARARLVEDICDTHIEAALWGLNEVIVFRRAQGDLKDKLVRAGQEQLKVYFAWLEEYLSDQRFFGGETFGTADIAVVPHINTSVGFKMGPAKGSKLALWWERAQERDSVKQALADLKSELSLLKELATSSKKNTSFKRQYRDHRLEWIVSNGGTQIVIDGLKADNIKFLDWKAFAPKSRL